MANVFRAYLRLITIYFTVVTLVVAETKVTIVSSNLKLLDVPYLMWKALLVVISMKMKVSFS